MNGVRKMLMQLVAAPDTKKIATNSAAIINHPWRSCLVINTLPALWRGCFVAGSRVSPSRQASAGYTLGFSARQGPARQSRRIGIRAILDERHRQSAAYFRMIHSGREGADSWQTLMTLT